MSEALAHRGPDGEGSWFDEATGVALGHRRLAIQDLSSRGHQPMISRSGRYVITFNGEIFNFKSLRTTLRHSNFLGNSDTEVLVELFERYGVLASLEKLNGMFAFAVWDRKEQRLTLARDRFGKKPLYYGVIGETFLFASELKALKRHPSFNHTWDLGATALYLRFGYIPAPFSIYTSVKKLEAGHYLQIDLSKGVQNLSTGSFYTLPAPAESELEINEEEACQALLALLRDSVAIRLQSDAPLGVFLSGGIDSSLIAAVAQEQTISPIQTFCVGFEKSEADEAPYARAVAKHLGTNHREFYLTSNECLEVISQLPTIYDEPFADDSQIPTVLISQRARKYVSVVLTGDGGDEGFFGYSRYRESLRKWNFVKRVALPVRKAFCQVADLVPGLAGLPRWENLRAGISANHLGQFYKGTISCFQRAQPIMGHVVEPTTLYDQEFGSAPDEAILTFLDFSSYLPEGIMTKVDRATMAVGLEARAPLLDHRVVDLGIRLPVKIKLMGSSQKNILKHLLTRYMPASLFDRPKQGFRIPLDDWLRTSLRPWAEDLLSQDSLFPFQEGAVRRLWQSHLRGRNNEHLLWNIFSFLQWSKREKLSRFNPSGRFRHSL